VHEFAAAGDEFKSFFKGESSGGAVGRHFSEGKARGGGGFERRDFFTKDFEQGESMQEKGGLAIAGAGEVLGGAMEHNVSEGSTEDLVGFCEEGFGTRIGFDEVLAHANFLGSLSGE
ncbi:MAG: hypothetical protein ACJA16_002309, partial [Akkermansiaceae bacterium]